ncbi:MAG: hypothetical protein ACTS6G_06290 [Candidatus Hodgkinia cicadicola]
MKDPPNGTDRLIDRWGAWTAFGGRNKAERGGLWRKRRLKRGLSKGNAPLFRPKALTFRGGGALRNVMFIPPL